MEGLESRIQLNGGLSDKKSYEFIKLENGLEVLIISHNQLNRKSAAAMLVEVGSFEDPTNLGGLAHYLEHMVFMGSEKYPSENEYDVFVDSHGGQCNACTEGEYTLYNFDVLSTHFFQALDIFAQCFISPLLSKDACNREIQAIDSEFNLAKVSDSARLQDIFCLGADPANPIRKFLWGNLESLKHAPEKLGINRDIELRKFHRKFYHSNNSKLVVLTSHSVNETISHVLKSFSNWSKINEIKFENLLTPPFCAAPEPVLYKVTAMKKNTHSMSVTWVCPSIYGSYYTKTHHYISHLIGHEGKGSILYLLKKLGYATSLSAGISEEESIYSNKSYSIFSITISLTLKGLSNWIEVVEIIYKYIGMMKRNGIPDYILEELQKMAQIDYDFQDERDESEFVESIATLMRSSLKIPPHHLLSSPYLIYEFNKLEIISWIEKYLVVQNSRVFILSSSFLDSTNQENVRKRKLEAVNGDEDEEEDESDDDGDDDEDDGDDDEDDGDDDEDDDDEEEDDEEDEEINDNFIHLTFDDIQNEIISSYRGPEELKNLSLAPSFDQLEFEPHFGTQYWSSIIPNVVLQNWNFSITSKLEENLHYPLENPFIPNVKSVTEQDGGFEIPKVVFQCNEKNNFISIWYSHNLSFLSPKVVVGINFVSLQENVNQKHFESYQTIKDLFGCFVKDISEDTMYIAEMAELNSNIIIHNMGITLKVSGFSDKAFTLINAILHNLFFYREYLCEDMWKRQSQVLERYYSNKTHTVGDASQESRLLCLIRKKVDNIDSLEILKSISDFKSTLHQIDHFLSSCCIEAYIEGDASLESAVNLGENLKRLKANQLSTNSITGNDLMRPLHKFEVTKLTRGERYFLPIQIHNTKETSCSVEIYYQIAPINQVNGIDIYAKLDLLEELLNEPYFNDIRTKKQIGYSVGCEMKRTYGILGFAFNAVSSAFSRYDVNAAISSFIQNVPNLLRNLTPEDFRSHVDSLYETLLNPHISLESLASERWEEIEDREYEFNLKANEATILKGIALSDLILFYEEYFLGNMRASITLHSYNNQIDDSENKLPSECNTLVGSPKELHHITSIFENN